MTKNSTVKYSKEFRLSTSIQRSPEWYKERAGLPSASGLGALLDRLKNGEPSAKSRDYRRQLAFERKFGVNYSQFQTKAMSDGIFYEDFAKKIYQKETGHKISEAFSYISDWFVATPDATVGPDGLLECKVVGDDTFMSIIEDGVPRAHMLQMQGQLLASGKDWVDYKAVNIKTKSYILLTVSRDEDLIQEIYDRLHEPLDLPELKSDHLRVAGFNDKDLDSWYDQNKPDDNYKIENLGF